VSRPTVMSGNSAPPKRTQYHRSIAIVSGKEGSGKSTIASTIAMLLSKSNLKHDILSSDEKNTVMLVDMDYTTGGLTYYLGLNLLDNPGVGISDIMFDLVSDESKAIDTEKYSQDVRNNGFKFIGLGNHKALYDIIERSEGDKFYERVINRIISSTKTSSSFSLFDCHGGIDNKSISVCNSVDEILIVVETDITSIQATRNLVDILHEHGSGGKISGFFVNKAFSDPSRFSRDCAAQFHARYLSSIPYDLDTAKLCSIGLLPDYDSVLTTQVAQGLSRLLPEVNVSFPIRSELRPSEFNEVRVSDMKERRGGSFAALFMLIAMIVIGLNVYTFGIDALSYYAPTLVVSLVGLLGSLDWSRRRIGYLLDPIVQMVTRRAEWRFSVTAWWILAMLVSTAAILIAVVNIPPVHDFLLPLTTRGTTAPEAQAAPDTCIQGYVWREALPDDHVCVTPVTRAQVRADNAQAQGRRAPAGGAYGPDTCKQGYVWREAFPDDHVCVTPATREQARIDNSQAGSRIRR
jgi:septum site-determining protein MinD